MSAIADQRFMARAFQLAVKGRYTVSPNPMVGAVVVRDEAIIGEGFHQRAGEAHAEVHAIADAGDCHGATIYVTLEPCNHHGRTPPCVDAIINAGIARVVIGVEDNNPEAAGGAARLKQNGIVVTFLGGWPEVNAGFVKRTSQGKPFVRCKLASSVDGRTAMASGESQWITGPAARYQVQKLRAQSCAVITGIGSVLADDSRLNVRTDDWLEAYPSENVRQPLRVVLDSQLRLPLEAAIVGSGTLVVCASDKQDKQKQLLDAGCEVVCLADEHGAIDLDALLSFLATSKHCNTVMLEAGAKLSGAFLQQGLINELHLFTANSVMGSQARPLFELPIDTMRQKISLKLQQSHVVGDDLQQIFVTSGQ